MTKSEQRERTNDQKSHRPMRKLRADEITRPDPAALEEMPRHPVAVMVENVRSIYNVGSIFRTSDASRIEHLYLTGITGTPEHRRLRKSSLGAERTVPWSYHDDPTSLLDRLHADGYTPAVLELTDTPTSVDEVSLDHFPMCLVVGNELHGVDDALVDRAELAFEIEQYGSKQSLNVAVAYGVAVFDLVRQYRRLTGQQEPAPDRSRRVGTGLRSSDPGADR